MGLATEHRRKAQGATVDRVKTNSLPNSIADQIREIFGINAKQPEKRVSSNRCEDKTSDDAHSSREQKPDYAVLDHNVSVAEIACLGDIHSLIEIEKSTAALTAKDVYEFRPRLYGFHGSVQSAFGPPYDDLWRRYDTFRKRPQRRRSRRIKR